MTGSWLINFAGRIFGPYGIGQMREFALEGRLAEQSLVARAGETNFRKAHEEPELASFFSGSGRPQEKAAPPPHRRDTSPSFGRSDDTAPAGTRAHFIVAADMKSGSIARLEEAIARLGQMCTIMPQAWLLSSEQPISIIRNLLVQQLGKLDLLFVIDATNDKAAWFNFGPEADARIRKFWRAEGKNPVHG